MSSRGQGQTDYNIHVYTWNVKFSTSKFCAVGWGEWLCLPPVALSWLIKTGAGGCGTWNVFSSTRWHWIEAKRSECLNGMRLCVCLCWGRRKRCRRLLAASRLLDLRNDCELCAEHKRAAECMNACMQSINHPLSCLHCASAYSADVHFGFG